MLVTSCLAFVHPAGSYGCLTWFKVPDEHGRRPPGPLSGMGGSDVRQRVDRAQSASRSAFDPYTAKLLRPSGQAGDCQPPGSRRTTGQSRRPAHRLGGRAGRLREDDAAGAVGRAQRPGFAWVSVDEADNDPKVLLTYVAEALDAVEPVGKRVFDALASPAARCPARSCRGWGRLSRR